MEFTLEQIEFIKANRLEMSMVHLAKHLEMPYSRLRNYMVANNLQVDLKTIQKIRVTKMKKRSKKRFWVKDPWNYNLNLITLT